MDVIAEILDIPFKPWEYMTYDIRRAGYRSHRSISTTYDYDTTFETLKNYARTSWKPGDVVQFGDGLYYTARKRWETWFLTGKDREDFLRRNRLKDKRIPVYARHQYAIVLARYRWIKYKPYRTFYDYGSFVMMLTGEKVGHIRKYYNFSPYTRIGNYPYHNLRPYHNINCEKLFHGVERGDDIYIFLEKLMRKLSNGN